MPTALTEGSRVGDKLYLRCPYCGDSDDPNRAHLAVYLSSGNFHCHRCGASGHYSLGDMLQLLDLAPNEKFGAPVASPKMPTPEEVETRAQLDSTCLGLRNRLSLVEHRFLVPDREVEIFESRSPEGNVLGYHLRQLTHKRSRNLGKRGFGFRGSRIPLGAHVRLVEGPYDVVAPEDVCVYGMPTVWQVQQLHWFWITLCPDGDIWKDPSKFLAWFRPFIFSKLGNQLVSVEYIPDGLDPDEVPPNQRQIRTWKQTRIKWYQIRQELSRGNS